MTGSDYATNMLVRIASISVTGLLLVYPFWLMGERTIAWVGDAFFGGVLFIALVVYVVQLWRSDAKGNKSDVKET